MTLCQLLAQWLRTKRAKLRLWWERLGAEPHICPDRAMQANSPMHASIVKMVGKRDYWVRRPNGDRCCSWCGSLHPDDFQRLCVAAHDDASGVDIEPSDKGYKTYVNQPGVRNADDGGIKFYHWHRDRDETPEFAAFERAYIDGVKCSRVRFKARWGAAQTA